MNCIRLLRNDSHTQHKITTSERECFLRRSTSHICAFLEDSIEPQSRRGT